MINNLLYQKSEEEIEKALNQIIRTDRISQKSKLFYQERNGNIESIVMDQFFLTEKISKTDLIYSSIKNNEEKTLNYTFFDIDSNKYYWKRIYCP